MSTCTKQSSQRSKPRPGRETGRRRVTEPTMATVPSVAYHLPPHTQPPFPRNNSHQTQTQTPHGFPVHVRTTHRHLSHTDGPHVIPPFGSYPENHQTSSSRMASSV